MILLNRFISILSVVITFILFEIIIFFPKFFWLSAVLILVIIVLTILKLSKWQFNQEILIFITIPLLFLSGGLLLLLFLEKSIIRHLMIVIINFFYGIYLDNLFTYVYNTEKYQPYSLENISSYLSLISAFLMYASFFGFITFFGAPIWLLGIITFLMTLILSYQVISLSKITWQKSWPFIAICGLLVVEIFGVAYFLPVSFYVSGLILTVIFYLLINIGRHRLLDNLDKKIVRRYILVGSLVMLLVLITAHWT